MHAGVKVYRGTAAAARNYLNADRSRADDYYLAPHRRHSPVVSRERADAGRLNGAEALDTSADDLRRFVGHLLQHRSPATAAVRSRSLRQFYGWAVRDAWWTA